LSSWRNWEANNSAIPIIP